MRARGGRRGESEESELCEERVMGAVWHEACRVEACHGAYAGVLLWSICPHVEPYRAFLLSSGEPSLGGAVWHGVARCGPVLPSCCLVLPCATSYPTSCCLVGSVEAA